MSQAFNMSDWTAVVLAGGYGTRLRQVCPGIPKPLVPISGRPFLDWVLAYLQACGFERVVISTGYAADQFQIYNGKERIAGVELETVAEPEPLGTAGGFLHAAESTSLSLNLIAFNADSLLLVALQPMLRDFALGSAEAALVAVHVEDASRFGTLDIDTHQQLRGFHEKQPGSGLVNAGIYFFRASALAHFPRKHPLSFESEVFPQLIASGREIRVYPSIAPFLDIGIPESLAAAPEFLKTHFDAFLRQVQS